MSFVISQYVPEVTIMSTIVLSIVRKGVKLQIGNVQYGLES